MTPSSFYEALEAGRYRATEACRGPWSRDHQHAGPPSALLARDLAAALPDGLEVARVTVELLRPIPLGVGRVLAEPPAGGRRVQRIRGRLMVDDRAVAEASLVAVRRAEIAAPAQETPRLPPPEGGEPFVFPFFDTPVGYHTAVELRRVAGVFGEGPTAFWLRMRIPLLPGEAPSPLTRALVAADSGNGVSPVLDWRTRTFINPELTVHLFRPPEGEWIGLDARTHATPTGVGLAETRLCDGRGTFGRGAQALLLE